MFWGIDWVEPLTLFRRLAKISCVAARDSRARDAEKLKSLLVSSRIHAYYLASISFPKQSERECLGFETLFRNLEPT